MISLGREQTKKEHMFLRLYKMSQGVRNKKILNGTGNGDFWAGFYRDVGI